MVPADNQIQEVRYTSLYFNKLIEGITTLFDCYDLFPTTQDNITSNRSEFILLSKLQLFFSYKFEFCNLSQYN